MLQRETGPFLIQEGSDWHECNRLLLPGNAQISTAALFSCLGTDWSSANGAAWGLSEVDSHSRLCFSNSEALKHKSSLSLSGVPWVSSLKQEGSDWHECDRLRLLPENAHSPLCKLLTKCWLSAYISRAWSVSCSHTAKVATKAVRRMTFLPNTYWWLRSLPMTKAKNSFPICEYSLSATGSAPLLDVTGWPYCNTKKPSPSLDASPWPSAGPLLLKYLSTGGFLAAFLIF